MFFIFMRGISNSRKLYVVTMDEGDSPQSSSAKINLIASVVAEKNMFFDLHLNEHVNFCLE